MKRSGKIWIVLVGTLVLGGGAAFAASKQADEPEPVAHVEVGRGDLVDRALAVGTIEPEVQISVKSKVSGVVKRIFAEEGTFVRAGDPLFEIRPDPTPLELVEARRQLELRGIELKNLQQEMERRRALQQRGLVSEQEYQTKQREYDEAVLQQKMARERLQLLEEGRIPGGAGVESVVRSPIDGYVLEKMVQVGDPVVPLSTYQEGTVLMTMADMGRLVFRGSIDEIDVGRLAAGMPAQIKVGALPDAQIQGTVRRISLKAKKQDNATSFPVEIALAPAPGVTLRAGLSANAEIVVEKRVGVLLLPERTVSFSGDTAWVTVRLPDGSTERRTLETGLSDALQVEVVSGLAEGERVLEKPVKQVG